MAHHVCLTGDLQCSGINPCKACMNLHDREVLFVAMDRTRKYYAQARGLEYNPQAGRGLVTIQELVDPAQFFQVFYGHYNDALREMHQNMMRDPEIHRRAFDLSRIPAEVFLQAQGQMPAFPQAPPGLPPGLNPYGQLPAPAGPNPYAQLPVPNPYGSPPLPAPAPPQMTQQPPMAPQFAPPPPPVAQLVPFGSAPFVPQAPPSFTPQGVVDIPPAQPAQQQVAPSPAPSPPPAVAAATASAGGEQQRVVFGGGAPTREITAEDIARAATVIEETMEPEAENAVLNGQPAASAPAQTSEEHGGPFSG